MSPHFCHNVLVWIFFHYFHCTSNIPIYKDDGFLSVVHRKMKEDSNIQLCVIWGPRSSVDEDWVFGILHHVKGVSSYQFSRGACVVHLQDMQSVILWTVCLENGGAKLLRNACNCSPIRHSYFTEHLTLKCIHNFGPL
jgi:hypothetical protein